MTELLTFDEAVAERNNPRLQKRYPSHCDDWMPASRTDFPFYMDNSGTIFHAHTKSLVEFRLKPEPREWWLYVRRTPNGFRELGVSETPMGGDNDPRQAIHVREVLADE